ncbi:MAG: GNAT family N-acetyltransferase [Hyphomicrobiaceae bacterium]
MSEACGGEKTVSVSGQAEGLVIRTLQADDKARWQALFKAYVAFYGATVTNDVVEETWQRLLANTDNMIGLVGEMPSRSIDGGFDIVGIVHAVIHASTWTKQSYCYLEDLYVDKQVRRAGIGQALIEAIFAEADKRNCTRTYWVTKEDNVEARALYDRLAERSPFVQYRRKQS